MTQRPRSILIFRLLANASRLAIFACVAASCSIDTWAEDPAGRSIFKIQETSSAAESGTSPSVPFPPGDLLLERATHPLMRKDLAIRGAVSCAAAGCHGGSRPGLAEPTALRGSEYPLWYENDPHARSWRTICSAQSLAIMQRLRITDGTTIRDRAGYDNCLACHNTTGHFGDVRVSSPLREGVGCAACHGPDAAWIDRHYRRDWHPSFERGNGFVAAGDLFVRARICASCHIGDADRDMNHDMIAAGHPPLRYEFATYHRRLPKHWRDEAACDGSRFAAQLWLAGQVAALDASLTLLEARAGKLNSVSVWPELAEYDCASCHHQLKIGDRDQTEARARRPGLPRYASWNRAGLELLLDDLQRTCEASLVAARLSEAIGDVEDILESNYRPDPVATAVAARIARQMLDEWIRIEGPRKRSEFDAHRLVELAIGTSSSAVATRNWESAVQFYLAALAGRAAWPEGPETLTSVRKLQSALRFPDQRAASSFPFDEDQTQRPTRGELEIMVEAVGRSLTHAAVELE